MDQLARDGAEAAAKAVPNRGAPDLSSDGEGDCRPLTALTHNKDHRKWSTTRAV